MEDLYAEVGSEVGIYKKGNYLVNERFRKAAEPLELLRLANLARHQPSDRSRKGQSIVKTG
jgi:hypothetical protein